MQSMEKCLQNRYRCASTDRRLLLHHQDRESPRVCTHKRQLLPQRPARVQLPKVEARAQPQFWSDQPEQQFATLPAPAPSHEPSLQPNPQLDMFGKVWQHLQEENREHLQEIGKVCCKRREPRSRFRFGMVPHQSMYHEDFGPKQIQPTKALVPRDNLGIPDSKVDLVTAHRLEYTPKELVHVPLLRPRDSVAFEGPGTHRTNYGVQYPDWGNCKRQIIPRDPAISLRNLPFNAKSVTRTAFAPKAIDPRQNCKPETKVRFGKSLPLRTTYGQHFDLKDKYPALPNLPVDAINRPRVKGDFGTIYRGDFLQPDPQSTLNKCHYSKRQVQIN